MLPKWPYHTISGRKGIGRMNDFFNYDGPFFRVLNRIGDLVILNLLWILCCIPIVTAGASAAEPKAPRLTTLPSIKSRLTARSRRVRILSLMGDLLQS